MQPIHQHIAKAAVIFAVALALVGCSSSSSRKSSSSGLPSAGSGRGGYYQDDGPGDKTPENLMSLPDAEPKVEPYASGSNRPYVVFGKTYTPITDNRPYKQEGIGSWYGKKFHGQRTSSGEIYDMYKMSAAHTTLPIPSYARVTNLANGRQVIVRINDRGPFHSGRIIDLSYTAALKLGYLGAGSAKLEVERLLPADIERIVKEKKYKTSTSPAPVVAPSPPLVSVPASIPAISSNPASQIAVESMLHNDANPIPVSAAGSASDLPAAKSANTINTAITSTQAGTAGNFYIQLGAYSQPEHAESARSQFQQQWSSNLPPVEVAQNGAVYRLFCGPFENKETALATAQKIQGGSALKPLVLQR
jgi:rare lipoprotein A